MESLILILYILLATTFVGALLSILRSSKPSPKLPPGPAPLPVIGSLLKLGGKPHKSLAELAKLYGPIMSLKLGRKTVVVVSSPALAREVLQKQDLAFSTRSVPNAVHAHGHNKYSVAWLPVADQWRSLRKALNSNIFSGQRLSYALRFEFKTTNNEAEYEALVVGLELVSAVGASHVLAKSDSQLVVGQVLGEYTVKEEVMQKYVDKVKAQVAKLQSFNIVRIPREENNEADYLAKLATAKEDAIPRNTPVRYLELPSIVSPDIQVQAINYSDSWTGPIVDYITNGTLPEDKVKGNRIDAGQNLRCQKVQELIEYAGKCCRESVAVDIGSAVFKTSLNVISNTIFSIDMADPTQDSVNQFRHLIWQIMVEAGKPNLADYFSILAKIDPQGIRRRLANHFGETFELFGRLIDERLELRRLRKSRAENDVIDILLNISEDSGEINRNHIEHLCLVCLLPFPPSSLISS
ncbi:hypothetical protein RHSIM_Rhsim08G0105300 [Rhododendron simsii]|uniref:Cytochrome P450 n=1 Tax=Rhododendron simsii TaxID=118357 RepID=A0A834GLA9_RHOSS|nr:hypothetical protein RHSIM_Rhsim08G0105300 [Rhododendron simsii]